MCEPIKLRIIHLAKEKGLSVRKFEEFCQLGRGNISNMKEDGAIGSDKLSRIIDNMPDVSAKWLLTGRGAMLHDDRPTVMSEPTVIYKSDPKDAKIIALQEEKIKMLEEKLQDRSVGLHTAPAADSPSVGGSQTSPK